VRARYVYAVCACACVCARGVFVRVRVCVCGVCVRARGVCVVCVCQSVCDLETSAMGRPRPQLGTCATDKINYATFRYQTKQITKR
jgi:hypothetical protein